ncbi:type II secretion system F family protein [Hippea maritima]|uniref:Type II secretion system F domain protein n=1 Tax=Hippea maritima (strain ATCC 700847 / DSM 10411 / MH2) TaxID=760142 RepID=F2LUC0_HIPMA|nr:type II secretion system F family protein [Hippea maritima]AEA33446.1 Type II secretion system F domain protein [Hippea maritima DSM 10411]
MPYFRWKGKDIKGRVRKGEIIASSKGEAMAKLKSKRISVINVKPAPKDIELPFLKSKIKDKELMIVTKQLASMLSSGLPLDESLNIMAEQAETKKMGEVLYSVKQRVESGASLSQALSDHKDVFSPMYIHMVNAGEQTGNLDGVLKRLSEMMEKHITLKRKIKGALIYPTMVTIVAVGVIALIMTFVIPTFADMYSSSGMHLPLPTQIVINVSLFMKKYFLTMLIIFIALLIALRIGYKKSYAMRRFMDKVLLNLPIFGELARKGSIANFTTILASLSSSGVDILDALSISAKTAGNLIMEETLTEVKDMVKKGENLSFSMASSGEFPDMVIQMAAVGEETGTLDEMMQKISQYYEEEVDNAVKNLTSMIEPILIIVLGGIIGFLVVSMYLPIFKMGETIK